MFAHRLQVTLSYLMDRKESHSLLTVMTLWIIQHIMWCVQGTTIRLRDVLFAESRPLASGIFGARDRAQSAAESQPTALPKPRLLLEDSVLFVVFSTVLAFGAGQKSLYLDP
jgi:hypothetical protein